MMLKKGKYYCSTNYKKLVFKILNTEGGNFGGVYVEWFRDDRDRGISDNPCWVLFSTEWKFKEITKDEAMVEAI